MSNAPIQSRGCIASLARKYDAIAATTSSNRNNSMARLDSRLVTPYCTAKPVAHSAIPSKPSISQVCASIAETWAGIPPCHHNNGAVNKAVPDNTLYDFASTLKYAARRDTTLESAKLMPADNPIHSEIFC